MLQRKHSDCITNGIDAPENKKGEETHMQYDKTIPFNGFCQQARLKLLPKRNLEAFAKLARRAAMGYIGAR